jgi:hypothetical protein
MFNGLPILVVQLLHFLQFARVSVILSDELCCDLNWLGGVNLEIGAWTEELLVSKTIRLHIAAILVTDTLESVTGCIVTAVNTFTLSLSVSLARVHGESRAVLVRLPDVNLSAATSVLAGSRVGVGGTWLPTFNIGLTIDELEIVWALGITIPSAILGTSISILCLAAVSIHLHKVQGSIKATIQLGIIHSVRELFVLQLEEHVGFL